MGRQKKPFPLGHFRLRYPKNYDKTKVYPVEIEYIFSCKYSLKSGPVAH